MLLTASALLLGWRTGLFNEFFGTIPIFGSVAKLVKGAAGTPEIAGVTFKEAAKPLCIVITDKDGARYGVKYDTEARNAVYDRTSSIISEALGSASVPAEVNEEEWRTSLSRPGVYFEYFTPVRLSVLDGWLGAHMSNFGKDISLKRIFIAFGEERSRIYYHDHVSGLFYGADTAPAAGKASELEIYSTNGACFAFETDIRGRDNAPYMLIMPGRYHPNVYSTGAGNALELLDTSLNAVGHRNETYTTRPDGEGIIRGVGTQFNITVDLQGRAYYHRTDGLPSEGEQQTLNESVMIEQSRVIIADTVKAVCGSADVFFDSIEYSAGDSCSVYFTYFIAGGAVFLFEDGYAAKITFKSEVITEIELNYRCFSLAEDSARLLSEDQALAAAEGEFMLFYADTGAEKLQPFWNRMIYE